VVVGRCIFWMDRLCRYYFVVARSITTVWLQHSGDEREDRRGTVRASREIRCPDREFVREHYRLVQVRRCRAGSGGTEETMERE
jgi:hypothetical protein